MATPSLLNTDSFSDRQVFAHESIFWNNPIKNCAIECTITVVRRATFTSCFISSRSRTQIFERQSVGWNADVDTRHAEQSNSFGLIQQSLDGNDSVTYRSTDCAHHVVRSPRANDANLTVSPPHRSLYKNQLTGTIPSSIGQLTALTYMFVCARSCSWCTQRSFWLTGQCLATN
jgi:hypothetical protein